ncbi:unnamed protein product [Gadus morhua 'NCC']
MFRASVRGADKGTPTWGSGSDGRTGLWGRAWVTAVKLASCLTAEATGGCGLRTSRSYSNESSFSATGSSTDGNCMYYLGENGLSMRRVILTEKEKDEVLTEVHAGHFGVKRMLDKINQRFYWKGITRDVQEWASDQFVQVVFDPDQL